MPYLLHLLCAAAAAASLILAVRLSVMRLVPPDETVDGDSLASHIPQQARLFAASLGILCALLLYLLGHQLLGWPA